MNQSFSALRPGRDFSCRGLALSRFGESCFPQGISTGSGGILDTMSPCSGNRERSQGHGPAVPADICPWPRLQAVPLFRPGLRLRATRQLGRRQQQLPGSSPHSPLVSVSAKQSLEGEPRAQVSPQRAEAAPASTHHAPQAAGLES